MRPWCSDLYYLNHNIQRIRARDVQLAINITLKADRSPTILNELNPEVLVFCILSKDLAQKMKYHYYPKAYDNELDFYVVFSANECFSSFCYLGALQFQPVLDESSLFLVPHTWRLCWQVFDLDCQEKCVQVVGDALKSSPESAKRLHPPFYWYSKWSCSLYILSFTMNYLPQENRLILSTDSGKSSTIVA